MISKELLSEVLGFGVYQSIRKDEYAYNDIKLNIINTELLYDYVNIYELAHKCKEWIINKGYVLKLCYVLENDTRELCFIETTLLRSNQYSSDYYDIDSKTEVEAVIKACEWILNSKDSK